MTEKTMKAFKKRAAQLALDRKDIRFVSTMGFLKAKGLLDTTLNIVKQPRARLDIRDVLWAARHIEPRIIEVLPAAILHFPKNFVGLEHAPQSLLQVIKCIQKNQNDGPNFEGLEYEKMKFWANSKLKDKRTKPSKQKRITKAFRLRHETLRKLAKIAVKGKFKDQTSAIEAAVERFEI